MEEDERNLKDEYKGMENEEVFDAPETAMSQVARSVTVVLSKLITQQLLFADVTLS